LIFLDTTATAVRSLECWSLPGVRVIEPQVLEPIDV
jgi:hypothetical protein